MIHTGSNQRIPEYHSWVALCLGMGINSYVELGCGSAWSFLRAGVKNIVTVDLLPNGLEHGAIPHIQGDSHDPDIVKAVIASLGGVPDVVFIDADHESSAVMQDFELWHPIARKLVGFHDILMPSVLPAWNQISRHHPSIQIVGRDLASADKWQYGGHHPEGHVNCGGIGVVFKEM